MRRLLSVFSTALLACTAMVGALGGAAMASTTATTINFNCVAHAPVVGDQSVAQALSFSTDAPDTVEGGATFSVVVTPQPLEIPSTVTAGSNTVTVNFIHDVKIRIPVPAGATYVSASLSGGSNLNSTPSIANNAGVLTVSIPGPLVGGTTVTPPVVTANLIASGAVGAQISPAVQTGSTGYQLVANANLPVIGTSDLPIDCAPPSPNPALSTTTIVDTTAPQVIMTNPADGAGYSLGSVVKANFRCDDGAYGSGVATCDGTLANGAALDTSSVGSHTFTVNTTDVAGNSASRTVTYDVVLPVGDVTPPTVTLTTPADGAVYTPGQAVTADYSCADETALASCTGTIASGASIDTATPGRRSFSVTGTDTAGNPTTVVHSYTVLATPTTVTGPTKVGTFGGGAINFTKYNDTDVWVKVTAPVANGGQLAMGDELIVEYSIFHQTLGVGNTSNWGPDPLNWVLKAPSNATILPGTLTADENGLNGETRGSAHAGGGSTGNKVAPVVAGDGQTGTIQWDDNSTPAAVPIQNGDGVLIHATFHARVTTPGTVSIRGFDGLTGYDCGAFGASCGNITTGGFPDASVGISFTARDTTPPTISVTTPSEGALYTRGQVVPADYTCADNVAVITCQGSGTNVDTLTSGPHQYRVTATDGAGNVAERWVTYNVTAPTAEVNACTANEGQACRFTVTLSNASTIPLSVDYATSDGTATAPGRYTASTGTVTFAPGETTKQVTVATVADSPQQPDQYFTLTISNAQHVTIGVPSAVGTVHDVSSAPYVIGHIAADVHRSSSSSAVASVPIVLQNAVGQAQASGLTVTAQYHMYDWDAHAPADYTAVTGSITFAPGETTKYVQVPVPTSNLAQQNRSAFVVVDHIVNGRPGGIANTTLGPDDSFTLGFFTIVNDNPHEVVGVDSPALTVPSGGTAWVTFNVSMTGLQSDDLRGVKFATTDLTALAGTDYDARTGSILWAPNAYGGRTISVKVHPTGAPGTVKRFLLTLSTPGGPVDIDPGKTLGVATITVS